MTACQCCISIVGENGQPRRTDAVARWTHWHGYSTLLCRACLDSWFDNADDDESLEPKSWSWLTGQMAPA